MASRNNIEEVKRIQKQNVELRLELKNYGPLFNSGKIKPGAIILSINNGSPTWENLTGALNNSFPGDEIDFQILQNSKVNNYKVVTKAVPTK